MFIFYLKRPRNRDPAQERSPVPARYCDTGQNGVEKAEQRRRNAGEYIDLPELFRSARAVRDICKRAENVAEGEREEYGAGEIVVFKGEAVNGYPGRELGKVADEYEQSSSIPPAYDIDRHTAHGGEPCPAEQGIQQCPER